MGALDKAGIPRGHLLPLSAVAAVRVVDDA